MKEISKIGSEGKGNAEGEVVIRKKREAAEGESTSHVTTAFMFVYVVCNDLSARLLDLDRFCLSATLRPRIKCRRWTDPF
jgi:hypothetical protein